MDENINRSVENINYRTSPVFNLPRAGLTTIIKVIIGYSIHKFPVRNKEISRKSGVGESDVSSLSKFLIQIGVLQGDNTKREITKTGKELGDLYQYGASDIEVSNCWQDIIKSNTFIVDLLKKIYFRGKLDRYDLRNTIFRTAGYQDPDSEIRAGVNALIEILTISNCLQQDKGLYFVAYDFLEKIKFQSEENDERIFFIGINLIKELYFIQSKFDLSRLIKYCEEINDNYEKRNYYSLVFVSRALLDHVPPIFGKHTFEQLFEQIGRHDSLKKACKSLFESIKNIADEEIHTKSSSKEVLLGKEDIAFQPLMNDLLRGIIKELSKNHIEETRLG